jgi:tetratricopeptide (TPR) repeat protein
MSQALLWTETDRRAIGQQLDRIISSEIFKRSERRRRFLTYVVSEALAGRSERLKGYSIALEVFDLPASFDPLVNPVVRIEAGRLRDKLRDYYETVGRLDPILIELPRGSYEPTIAFQNGAANLPGAETPGVRPSANPARILSLYGASRSPSDGTARAEARDEFLRGLSAFWRYSRLSCFEAQEHFSRAIKLDRKYAAAHAWLTRALVFEHAMNWNNGRDCTLDLAFEHSNRAVALDGQSPMAQAVQGWVLLYKGDGPGAIMATRRACDLEPNFADGRLFLALALVASGDGEAAMRNIETAMLLQPHPSSFYYYAMGLCHFALAEYEYAIEAFLEGIQINPSFMPNRYALAIAYGVTARNSSARQEGAIIKADCPDTSKNFFLCKELSSISCAGKKVAGLNVN